MYSRTLVAITLLLCAVFAPKATACTSFRHYNGSCNNIANPQRGVAGSFFLQTEGYTNYKLFPVPNERTVSNSVLAYPDGKIDHDYDPAERKTGLIPDPENRNGFFAIFSQFVAHDISQNPLLFNFANVSANYQVQIEDPDDPLYQPELLGKTGILTMPSNFQVISGVVRSINGASSYLDLSTTYGSSEEVANKLRKFQGGRLEVDETGINLPFGSINGGVPSECGSFRPGVSAAGDLRADENGVLMALHTLFMRLHNIFADEFATENPSWTDEQIFQAARNLNIAHYQSVVYNDFLPALLGNDWNGYKRYRGYDSNIDVTPTNAFATAAYRTLHDIVPLPSLILFENCTHVNPELVDNVSVQETVSCIPLFFRRVTVEAAVRGALNQYAQAHDGRIVNGLRSVFLRATTPGGNLDIEVANIFRGREHQVASFNKLRQHWTGKSLYQETGCSAGATQDPIACFKKITNNDTLAATLQSLYQKVDRIDAYIGLLAESKKNNDRMPSVTTAIIVDQFDRLRHGDRFYFENQSNGLFTRRQIREIKRVTMSDLLEWTYPTVHVRRNAFKIHNTCDI